MSQNMTESFAELFESSFSQINLSSGAIISAIVTHIGTDFVTVSAGLKSEAIIPVSEFKNNAGQLTVVVGDTVEVAVESIENGYGETRLSREKAKRAEAWQTLETAFESNGIIIGTICERVKGGFTVDLDGIRAFLPGSLVDVRPLRDPASLEGKELEFKLVKIDKKRNNIVVSRRAVVEAESTAERKVLMENLEEGQEVVGIVKNLTDYGAFIDLGGIDGLLHITDMSWKRVKHPSEMVEIAQELRVRILKFDRDKNRVSLGLKQLAEDPWLNVTRRFPVNSRLFGKVTNLTDYGCFIEIEDGIEGLVHMSEMDWTNKNIHPSKIVQVGDEVEVMVLEIDEKRRRISLGLKQCIPNPWTEFAATHSKGDQVSGKIKSITDFGIFIGLDGAIDGLVHMSDISWAQPAEKAIRDYKKGDQVTAIVLAIDPERERISLGIKQLDADPIPQYLEINPRGTQVTGKVTQADEKMVLLQLSDGVQACLKTSELDATPAVENEITAWVLGLDRKGELINLSMKEPSVKNPALEEKTDQKETQVNTTTLGDLIQEQIDKDVE